MVEDLEIVEAGETSPPKPKKRKAAMVNVVNTCQRRSFHLGGGVKIRPGEQRKIPKAIYDEVKDSVTWLKRAERGDVI